MQDCCGGYGTCPCWALTLGTLHHRLTAGRQAPAALGDGDKGKQGESAETLHHRLTAERQAPATLGLWGHHLPTPFCLFVTDTVQPEQRPRDVNLTMWRTSPQNLHVTCRAQTTNRKDTCNTSALQTCNTFRYRPTTPGVTHAAIDLQHQV